MEFKIKYDYGIGEEERQTVLQVLQDDIFTLREHRTALEKEFSERIGIKFVIGTNSGTSAVHCSLLALGIYQGDEVITVDNQHATPAFTIMACGAKPVFVDCEEETLNIDPALVEAAITPKTKAILPVHTAGHPYDGAAINEIAEKYDLPVIEDAAQSLGAKIRGKYVGNFGTVAIFSFARHKHVMGGGRGGIIATDDEDLAEKLRQWSSNRYGRTTTPTMEGTKVSVAKPLDYQAAGIGLSYYMSELHAAIARVQLKKFFDPHGSLNPIKKRQIANFYTEQLSELSFIKTPKEKEGMHHSFLRYIVRVPKRDELYQFLTEKGIELFVHYPVPLHRSKFYVNQFGPQADSPFPITEKTCREVLTLPSWPQLTTEQLQFVVDGIKEFYQTHDPD